MGAPVPEMEAAENASAEDLLNSLETLVAKERRKHATVYNYWLSIRGNRPFPPIRDLDPLEISDAGPFSVLLELIGGGENADIRHLGQAIRFGGEVERLSDAPDHSLLSCIHAKLAALAISGQALAFEDEITTDDGTKRCWVTLLPFSATGGWIDFVYGFVSLDDEATADEEDSSSEESDPIEEALGSIEEALAEPAEVTPEAVEEYPEPEAVEELHEPEAEAEPLSELNENAPAETAPEPFKVPLGPLDEDYDAAEAAAEPVETTPEAIEDVSEPEAEPVSELVDQVPEALDENDEPGLEPDDLPEFLRSPNQAPATKPGFSAKLFESLASVGGFYGKVVQVAPSDDTPEYPEPAETDDPAEAVTIDEPTAADEPVQPTYETEGHLQSKLSEVRAKAEEAREAQMRSHAALIEGLSAAYDFALDAEQEPEEYLRLVEAQGLKIQLRSPMKPVVKLGFDGMCDAETITQLEAVLSWALKNDLPRGSLVERIEAEGGIENVLNGQASA